MVASMLTSPNELSTAERACLELAWQALLAGTTPVGAVVTDADGVSLLAHAEITALIGLPVSKRHYECRLVTLLEPCQLCAGVLASDRYAGRHPVKICGPRTDQIGRLASGLHVAFYLRRRPEGPVIAAYREMRPDLAAAGEALIQAGIFDLVHSQAPWPVAAGELLAAG